MDAMTECTEVARWVVHCVILLM